MGWTYYGLVQILNPNRTFLDLISNDSSAQFIFMLSLIHFSIFTIVSIILIKSKIISKKEFTVISLLGISVSLSFLFVYHFFPEWL